MIRFALKSAFAIGIAALFIPGLGSDGEGAEEFDMWKGVIGIQAAVEDVLGFCTRAPQACEAGSEFSAFAMDRVEEGIAVALDAAGPAIVRSATSTSAAEGTSRAEGSQETSTIDLGDVDPALLLKLDAYARSLKPAIGSEMKLPTGSMNGEVSADMIDAVRQAATLARQAGAGRTTGFAEKARTRGDLEGFRPSIDSVPRPEARPDL